MINFKINKKKISAILLVFGISLTNTSIAESYKAIKINADHVNVRTAPIINNKNNIIGRTNKGDTFKLINHEGEWYLVDYYGENAYINDAYGMEITINNEVINETNNNEIVVAKITGNNVNIRSSANKDNDNIIGFADVTDSFKILGIENEWYIIDYLDNIGYVHSSFVKEQKMYEEDLNTTKIVYLNNDSFLYSDTNKTYLTILPKYQYLNVIKEENGYYKVRVDGLIGYIDPVDTKKLTNTFIVSDLGRQIVKVFKNNKEVYRAHMISGRKDAQTDIGIFKIGHKVRDYQLTKKYKVKFWMQYNGNEGLHDAYWQEDKYFVVVARKAYERFASGKTLNYPYYHGSNGCDNLKEEDAKNIYSLVNVGDNVLVIEANDLIKDNLISKNIYNNIYCKPNQKVKKLT